MAGLLSDQLLVILSAAIVLAVLATRYAYRFGLPVVLLFIAAGVLAGSEGAGGIEFENYALTQLVGTLALVVILFDGGFHTEQKLFRLGLWPALKLAVFGTFGAAGLVAVFAVAVFGFSWLEGLLMGSVVASTDAAAVFATLRKQNLVLKKRVQAVLEVESGSNDPPAVYLTVAFTTLLLRGESPGVGLLGGFLGQMLIGLGLGWLGGRGAGWLLRRVRFDLPGLYPLVVLALAVFLFSLTNLLGGSGFLAVYVAGVVLGNQPLPFKPVISRFHDGMSWLMQILMFFTLGLLVFPSRLLDAAQPAIALALFLMFVARPAITWLLLVRSGLDLRERLLVAWGGLRGAVPIILAIYPLMQGVERSHTIFNTVFFVVILSVLVQGTTVGWLARRFRLHMPAQAVPPLQMELASWKVLDGEVLLFRVESDGGVAGRPVRDLPIPSDVLAMLIVREDALIPPRGSTVFQPDDFVYFFAKEKDRAALEELFQK
ncbi:MAG: potassium/proton antiporter [Acidobacteria bacterium]|nr:potassium/proton antiporter [Acidobacteriota bacterium]